MQKRTAARVFRHSNVSAAAAEFRAGELFLTDPPERILSIQSHISGGRNNKLIHKSSNLRR